MHIVKCKAINFFDQITRFLTFKQNYAISYAFRNEVVFCLLYSLYQRVVKFHIICLRIPWKFSFSNKICHNGAANKKNKK